MNYDLYMNEYNKIGYSKKGITIIDNAVEKEDLDKLNNFILNQNRTGPIGQWEIEDEEIKNIIIKYENITYGHIEKNYVNKFGVKVDQKPENPGHLVKWADLGEGFMPHSDSETRSRKPAVKGGFYRYNITTIYYLTDGYIGGEIYYPDFDNFQPKVTAGTLVMFPSRYTHAIHPLQSGTRHTMPAWFRFSVEDEYTKSDHGTEEDISSVLFDVK